MCIIKNRFEELFKGTWIYDHPTGERGQYLVMVLNFSFVDPDLDKVDASFLNLVKGNAVAFIEKYREYLSTYRKMDYYSKLIEESGSASDVLTNLLLICKGAGQNFFMIIDEYDNFANTILSTKGKDAYHELTRGTGFFRSFFNVLKSGTSRSDSPITRPFIDYDKLKYLILIDQNRGKASNGNFDQLKEIIEKGEISAKIQDGFPLEKLSSRENFISLLFYEFSRMFFHHSSFIIHHSSFIIHHSSFCILHSAFCTTIHHFPLTFSPS
ncbi:MAG: AAA family ATPase [Acidobacteria bacterium]|jgi:hypothetical protein|nr:AAA family ATPase [Acidobacteriota bacterium]